MKDIEVKELKIKKVIENRSDYKCIKWAFDKLDKDVKRMSILPPHKGLPIDPKMSMSKAVMLLRESGSY